MNLLGRPVENDHLAVDLAAADILSSLWVLGHQYPRLRDLVQARISPATQAARAALHCSKVTSCCGAPLETGAGILATSPKKTPPAVTTAPTHDQPVLARLIDFLERTFPQAPRPLLARTTLPDAVLADSLSYLEVVMFLETAFDLSFEPRDLQGTSFETPQAIAALVERKMMDSR